MVGILGAVGCVLYALRLRRVDRPRRRPDGVGLASSPTLSAGDVVLVSRHTSVTRGNLLRCADPQAPGRFVIARAIGAPGESLELRDEVGHHRRQAPAQPARAATRPPFVVHDPQTDEDVDPRAARSRTTASGTSGRCGRSTTPEPPDQGRGRGGALVSRERRSPHPRRLARLRADRRQHLPAHRLPAREAGRLRRREEAAEHHLVTRRRVEAGRLARSAWSSSSASSADAATGMAPWGRRPASRAARRWPSASRRTRAAERGGSLAPGHRRRPPAPVAARPTRPRRSSAGDLKPRKPPSGSGAAAPPPRAISALRAQGGDSAVSSSGAFDDHVSAARGAAGRTCGIRAVSGGADGSGQELRLQVVLDARAHGAQVLRAMRRGRFPRRP